VVLEDSVAVESGSGARKSTNYMPRWRIEGWAARPADMPLVETQTPAPRQAANGAMQPPVSTNDANRAANTDDFG
jgi:hypothetical protein